jgi:hypothetical protein
VRYRIGVERNHTVLLLYVSVFNLSTFFCKRFPDVLKGFHRGCSLSDMNGIFIFEQLRCTIQIVFVAEGKPEDAGNVFPAFDDLHVAQINPVAAKQRGNMPDDAWTVGNVYIDIV